MAKKTIEELKERFKTGMFPTQSDYEDVLDSILTAVTTDDVKGVGEYREKTLTQMLESIDTSRIPGLDDFIRNVESFLAGIEVNKTLVELLEGLKKEIEYTAGNGININNNVISANTDVLVTKSDLDRKAERSELNSIKSTVLDLESRKAERSELNSKANVSEIPDVSNFITRDDIPDVDLTTLDMYYNSDNKTFELKYKNEILSQVDVSEFVKDGMLDTARLEGTNLVIVFNTDSGKQPITIDLSKLIKAYTAGNGIQIINNTISITEDVATKNDIPSLEGYATETYVDESLTEINEAVSKIVNGETPVGKEYIAGEGININDTAISADTTKLATKDDLEGFARLEDLPNPNLFVSKEELETKANKSEIPDVSNFITRDDIPEIPDTSNFVTRDEIPTVPENVSAFNNDAGYLTEHQDLSEYATKSEIPDVSNFVTSEQIPNTDEFVTRGELPNFSEFATASELNNKADRSELPDWTQFVTASELNNKADRSDIPSLEGYATEEYVNNAVANAGGSSNSGNYLKLVNDLDNYEFAEGEIVKYNGNTGTYINGADYQQKETTTNGILIPAGSYKTNFGSQDWSQCSNGLFLSPPNGYFTNISARDYSIKILLYDKGNKKFSVPSDVKVGDYAITGFAKDNAISFEKVTAVGQNNSEGYPQRITIYGKGDFAYISCPEKGEGGYINGNLFVGNTSYTNLYITYVDGISHMFIASPYNESKGPQTNEDIYLSGKTIKSIELTDFCKRALNIE